MKRDEITSILNYENQLLPPFMEDMEDYMRCLDEIAVTNHIEEVESVNAHDDVPQES